jgi:hypothetical protein
MACLNRVDVLRVAVRCLPDCWRCWVAAQAVSITLLCDAQAMLSGTWFLLQACRLARVRRGAACTRAVTCAVATRCCNCSLFVLQSCSAGLTRALELIGLGLSKQGFCVSRLLLLQLLSDRAVLGLTSKRWGRLVGLGFSKRGLCALVQCMNMRVY